MSKNSNALAENNEPKSYPELALNRPDIEQNIERLGTLLREIQKISPEKVAPQQQKIEEVAAPARSLRDTTALLRNFTLTDSIALIIGFLSAWTVAVLVNLLLFTRFLPNNANDVPRIAQFFFIGAGVILWFEHTSHYNVRLPFWIETKKIVSAMALAMLIDGFLEFASKQDFSRLWLMTGWIFAAFFMIIFRGVWRRVLRRRGAWRLPTLLIGNGSGAEDVKFALDSEPGLGYDIVGKIDDIALALQESGFSWRTLCARYKAEYVILALNGNDAVKGEQALSQLMREDIPYSIAPTLYRAPVFGMVPQYFFNHDVMLMTHNHGLDRGLPCFFKRTFDIVVAASALLALSPALLVIALMIKQDGGPALYGHKRLGLNGKTFPCMKFRSMIANSEEVLKKHLAENAEARAEWARDFKLRDDPRVTSIGKFLRKTSLDELPQLLNVLKGDMSIVGPRPIIVAETERYESDISHYYRVRPGVTGLWQVSGRNDVSYAQRVHMDTWYVRNWSVWHDIAIICKTVPVVLKRKGAY